MSAPVSDRSPTAASHADVASVRLARATPLAAPDVVRLVRREVVPLCSLVAALGLLLIALAYNAARAGQAWADGIFWAGLLVMFTPVVVRLLSTTATRSERLALVVLLAEAGYLLKVLYSPLVYTFPDELQHSRTLSDMLASGALFQFNPTLRVSPLYPGLEIVTDALVWAAGLSPFLAGLAIVAVARLVLVLGLFLFYEQIGGSARLAALAVTFYAANPNFVYLDGQFAYETLALALMAFCLFVIVRQPLASGLQLVALSVIALLASAAVVVTHHFTQFVLVGVLAGWALATLAVLAVRERIASPGERRLATRTAIQVGLAAIVTATAATLWLIGVAQPVVDYLRPNFVRGFVELADLIAGAGSVRVPFRNGAGVHSPLLEQAVGYLSIAFVLVALPYGLLVLWRKHRLDGAALALAALAIAYPLSLPLRLTDGGAESAGRLPEFLYFGIAFVVALSVTYLPRLGLPAPVRLAALTTYAMVVLLGAVFVGWGPPGRLPGSYLVAAAVRSVDEQSLASAAWARGSLGPDNTMTADWSTTLVMGSYGGQRVVSVSNTLQDASQVLYAPDLGVAQRQVLKQLNIRYVVVDWRLATGLPVSGIYFESQEPDAFAHTTPISLDALQKFDTALGVSRVFDSGSFSIFDVSGVGDAD